MRAACEGPLKGILEYSDEPLVSIDFNHNPASSNYDASLTKVLGGKLVKVCSWYDNEWGFSNRMLDTTLALARRPEGPTMLARAQAHGRPRSAGKRVLIREDLNVPLKDGHVASDARLSAALPTLRAALEQRRARAGAVAPGPPQGRCLRRRPSRWLRWRHASASCWAGSPARGDWLDGVEVAPGEIALCENVRFERGEKANDPELARRMAALCDVFVMDAFGTAHRAQASTVGVAEYAPVACAGPLLVAELDAFAAALENPRRPLVAIVGGAKVSSKLEVLQSLAGKVDELILGGGIANTVLAAAGWPSAARSWRRI